MENIPQPADEPYSKGDEVRIYLADDDMDSSFHGLTCEVVKDEPDNLDETTGREIDRHHYQLRRLDNDELLPTWYRHTDLVPASEWPERE